VSGVLAFEWALMMIIAGVAGRWRGRFSASIVAACCAGFWLALCLVIQNEAGGLDRGSIGVLTAGTVAILVVAAWSGHRSGRAKQAALAEPRRSAATGQTPFPSDIRRLGEALQRFDDWLERYRHDADPWPEFDEFLRSLLHENCRAARVKPYRILSEEDAPVPLRAAESAYTNEIIVTPRGVMSYVIRTGRSWRASNPACRADVPDAATTGHGPIAWAFPVQQAGRTIGVVTVGELPPAAETGPLARDLLDTLERLVSQCWIMLLEVCRSRASATTDPASGLLTLSAFTEAAEHVWHEARRRGEPLAVLVIAAEGLRTLEEGGRWTQAGLVISRAGNLLAQRCRSSDLLARFDESRFLMLLRRVDLDLAVLIASELLQKLFATTADVPNSQAVRFRGGIAMGAGARPDLGNLITQAVERCHRARRQGLPLLATEVQSEAVV